MRMDRVGAAALAAAAVAVLSASAPLAPPAQPPVHRTPVLILALPDRVSFDDLAPTDTALRRPPPAPVTTSSRARLTRPPRAGVVGNAPPAGTPQAVLAAAYLRAVSRAAKGCHLQPAHLAAIGQVESGSIGGRRVTADHRVSPAIYGPLLDGGPFAVVQDSDGGAYDGAGDYDRAVGPLQFLPGTWSWAGRDGDGDGRRDPQNVFDAAFATADYLCRDGRDLARSGDLRAAVLSYNQSGAYHSAVVEWVSYFKQHGLAALTTVAFRVGSGGRASDLKAGLEPPDPPAAPTPTRVKDRKDGKPQLTSPSTGGANGAQVPSGPSTPTGPVPSATTANPPATAPPSTTTPPAEASSGPAPPTGGPSSPPTVPTDSATP